MGNGEHPAVVHGLVQFSRKLRLSGGAASAWYQPLVEAMMGWR